MGWVGGCGRNAGYGGGAAVINAQGKWVGVVMQGVGEGQPC